ncbi:MAG: SLBB domain-containing protein [Smithellaceae bacterium]|nr:SLBB domain-containing protein [Smithellaceae bacterium]
MTKLASAFLAFILLFLLSPAARGQEYEVGEGDLLRITVYDNPDLTTEVRISGEGKIIIPLVGEVSVKALTATGIGKKLAALFAEGYIKNPQVSVFIREYKSKKVTALGEFTKPGLIELRGNSTLMEVVSNAGGITPNAGETLFVQRSAVTGDPSRKSDITISVDLSKLLEKGDMASNIPVLDGDSIFVPRASTATALGEFTRPGLIQLRSNATLIEVISNAGGITPNAGETLFIQRSAVKGDPRRHSDITLSVDLTKLLEKGDMASNISVLDGDSIYVPRASTATALGEFTKPGLIQLRSNSTLLEVVSNAGGITVNAGETLFIQRSAVKGDPNRKTDVTISVDLIKLLEKGDRASNIPVLDGDSIYVPKAAKATVLGEFTRPGLIQLRGNSTLLEVVSNAGGITPNAGETLFIQRSAAKDNPDRKGDITLSVDLTKLLEEGDRALNLPVLDGDSIYVPKASFVYVMGEVKSPGAYKITRGLTVLRSITLAGGFTKLANKNKTKITRKVDKVEKTIDAKMDHLVLPDDIILVPESFF